MSAITAQNESFVVHGPDQLKKGETGVFSFAFHPAYDTTDTISRICELLYPDGRRVSLELKLKNFVFSGTGISIERYYVQFTPTSLGTHDLCFQFYNSTAIEYFYGYKSFEVPAWLENIDKPISDIEKSNTEISRLRTRFNPNKNII